MLTHNGTCFMSSQGAAELLDWMVAMQQPDIDASLDLCSRDLPSSMHPSTGVLLTVHLFMYYVYPCMHVDQAVPGSRAPGHTGTDFKAASWF